MGLKTERSRDVRFYFELLTANENRKKSVEKQNSPVWDFLKTKKVVDKSNDSSFIVSHYDGSWYK